MRWKNTQLSWGWISIVFHWFTTLMVFGLFVLGLWMVDLTYYDEWYRKAPHLHKSIGIMMFLLTLFRLLWRYFEMTPDTLETHSEQEKKIAHVVHRLLYLLLLLVMFTGYLISTADGRAIEVFGLFSVPASIIGITNQEDVAGVIHLSLALVMIALVAMHALAAIKHHLIDKDRTLLRMLGR